MEARNRTTGHAQVLQVPHEVLTTHVRLLRSCAMRILSTGVKAFIY